MPAPRIKPKRYQPLAREIDPSLAILGFDPGEDSAPQVEGAVKLAADLVRRAGMEIEGQLTPGEWAAIAEVLNGTLDAQLHGRSSLPASLVITANLEDSVGVLPSEEMSRLLGKLRNFTELQCEAVAAAVRYFWSRETPPGDWWLLKHRLPRVER